MVARIRNKEMGVVSVAAAATMQTMEAYPCKTMELKWISRPRIRNFKDSLEMFSKSPLSLALIPIYISTKPYNVNPDELVQLYGACKHSCFRFPNHLESESESDNSAIDAVDVHKLRIALSHSSILVSVFCKPNDVVGDASSSMGLLGDLIQRVRTPVSPQNSQLVGFGRAISDEGLTASIHDVMVLYSNFVILFRFF